MPQPDRLAAAIPKFQARPAGRTGDNLGLKAPVKRIVEFRLALRAEGELLHRRVLAVISVNRGPQLVQLVNGYR